MRQITLAVACAVVLTSSPAAAHAATGRRHNTDTINNVCFIVFITGILPYQRRMLKQAVIPVRAPPDTLFVLTPL